MITQNKKIAAGIVVYKAQMNDLVNNIKSIQHQVDIILLHINEETDDYIFLSELSSKIHLLTLHKNVGMAGGLNNLSRNAIKRGYQWLLTLDQDSICSSTMINEYFKYLSEEKIALVSPIIKYIDEDENYDLSYIENFDKPMEYIQYAITSGSLINLNYWSAINGFDDWFFIDYVDFDYCIKLKVNGYSIIRVNSTYLYQRLGNQKHINFFGKKITTYNHSSFRNYYFVRNSLFFIRKYRKHICVIKELYVVIKWEFIKLIFERQRIKTLFSAVKGFIASLNRRINH